MTLQREYLNGVGGLVKLAPLSCYRLGSDFEPDFHRIIGSEVTLAFLKSLVVNTEEARHHWPAVYKDAIENLEEIVVALSEGSDDYNPFDVKEQICETVLNYYQKEETDLPELRSKFQRYKLLLENCHNGIELTKQEEADKKDFIKILDFFIRMEEVYNQHQRYIDSLDDE